EPLPPSRRIIQLHPANGQPCAAPRAGGPARTSSSGRCRRGIGAFALIDLLSIAADLFKIHFVVGGILGLAPFWKSLPTKAIHQRHWFLRAQNMIGNAFFAEERSELLEKVFRHAENTVGEPAHFAAGHEQVRSFVFLGLEADKRHGSLLFGGSLHSTRP